MNKMWSDYNSRERQLYTYVRNLGLQAGFPRQEPDRLTDIVEHDVSALGIVVEVKFCLRRDIALRLKQTREIRLLNDHPDQIIINIGRCCIYKVTGWISTHNIELLHVRCEVRVHPYRQRQVRERAQADHGDLLWIKKQSVLL